MSNLQDYCYIIKNNKKKIKADLTELVEQYALKEEERLKDENICAGEISIMKKIIAKTSSQYEISSIMIEK